MAGVPSYFELTEMQCEALYASDDMGHRIIDLLPNEATREWIELELPEDIETKISTQMDRLRVRSQFRTAFAWARMYGGSGLYVAVKDGLTPDKPIDLSKIKEVNSLVLFSCFELIAQPTDIDADLNSPTFGLPTRYNLVMSTGGHVENQVIHASRILRFDGVALPRHLFAANRYWGGSVFSLIFSVLRDFNIGHSSVAALMQDLRLMVLEMEGLTAATSNKELKKRLHDRLDVINTLRSVLNVLLIDKGAESISYQSGTVQGVGELLDALKLRLQAAVDIPHTILFNESPSGTLGPTGNSEMLSWYDHVRNQQEEIFSPPLDRLFKIIFAAKDGAAKGQEPAKWSYKWKPLWQPSVDETLSARQKQADVDARYIEMGVLDPAEVRNSRFGGAEFSIETTIDRSLDKLLTGQQGDEGGDDDGAAVN